jgi:hypothetical protein
VARIAFFKVGGHLDRGHVLPVLRFGEELPTLARIVCGLLTAQGTHRAQASNVFHWQAPPLGYSHLIPPLATESLHTHDRFFCVFWLLTLWITENAA